MFNQCLTNKSSFKSSSQSIRSSQLLAFKDIMRDSSFVFWIIYGISINSSEQPFTESCFIHFISTNLVSDDVVNSLEFLFEDLDDGIHIFIVFFESIYLLEEPSFMSLKVLFTQLKILSSRITSIPGLSNLWFGQIQVISKLFLISLLILLLSLQEMNLFLSFLYVPHRLSHRFYLAILQILYRLIQMLWK